MDIGIIEPNEINCRTSKLELNEIKCTYIKIIDLNSMKYTGTKIIELNEINCTCIKIIKLTEKRMYVH